jgi:hypothetical protein
MVCRGPGRNCTTSPLSRAPDPLPAPGEAALATVPRAASDSTIAADSVPRAAPDARPCSTRPTTMSANEPATASSTSARAWPAIAPSSTARRPSSAGSSLSQRSPTITATAYAAKAIVPISGLACHAVS